MSSPANQASTPAWAATMTTPTRTGPARTSFHQCWVWIDSLTGAALRQAMTAMAAANGHGEAYSQQRDACSTGDGEHERPLLATVV